jgi:hypothetical protein
LEFPAASRSTIPTRVTPRRRSIRVEGGACARQPTASHTVIDAIVVPRRPAASPAGRPQRMLT